MKIFFVGMHNKSGLQPLDSSTLSGKKIDIIIKSLGYPCIKTNLCEVDRFVQDRTEIQVHNLLWSKKYQPIPDDIIVLLGRWTQKHFLLDNAKIVKLGHPAAWCQYPKTEDYVNNALQKIKNEIK